MPLDLQIIRAHEFIRMGGRGRIDFAASREVLETLGAACRLRGIDRAMLDVRSLKSDITTKELSTLVNMFREVGFSHGHRLALLHSTEQEQYRRARAFAFLSALRGWIVRAFIDFEQALAWLALEGPDLSAHEMGEGSNIPVKGGVVVPPIRASASAASTSDTTFKPTIKLATTPGTSRKRNA